MRIYLRFSSGRNIRTNQSWWMMELIIRCFICEKEFEIFIWIPEGFMVSIIKIYSIRHSGKDFITKVKRQKKIFLTFFADVQMLPFSRILLVSQIYPKIQTDRTNSCFICTKQSLITSSLKFWGQRLAAVHSVFFRRFVAVNCLQLLWTFRWRVCIRDWQVSRGGAGGTGCAPGMNRKSVFVGTKARTFKQETGNHWEDSGSWPLTSAQNQSQTSCFSLCVC